MAELLKLYRKYPCMYEIDNSWDGFEWINADDADRSTYSFIRKTSREKTKRLLFVLNMTPVERKDYCVGVPEKKKYKLVLNSAEKRFGGSGEELKTDYTATAEPTTSRTGLPLTCLHMAHWYLHSEKCVVRVF